MQVWACLRREVRLYYQSTCEAQGYNITRHPVSAKLRKQERYAVQHCAVQHCMPYSTVCRTAPVDGDRLENDEELQSILYIRGNRCSRGKVGGKVGEGARLVGCYEYFSSVLLWYCYWNLKPQGVQIMTISGGGLFVSGAWIWFPSSCRLCSVCKFILVVFKFYQNDRKYTGLHVERLALLMNEITCMAQGFQIHSKSHFLLASFMRDAPRPGRVPGWKRDYPNNYARNLPNQ